MKRKIEIKPEDKELNDRIANDLEDSGMSLISLEELQEYEDLFDEFGLEYGTLDICGRKYGIVMKQSLRDALFDPSSDDLDTLRKARDYLRDKLRASGGKIMIKESPLERSINDRYLSSLVMTIIKYPTDKPFRENLEQLGVYDEEIRKLYAEALSAWLGEPTDLNFDNMTTHVKKVGYTGSTETINLDLVTCGNLSHYVVVVDVRKKQEKVNKEVIELSKEYLEIENKIVEYINEYARDEKIRNNSRNLVRMFLNLSVLYDKGKPLPIR